MAILSSESGDFRKSGDSQKVGWMYTVQWHTATVRAPCDCENMERPLEQFTETKQVIAFLLESVKGTFDWTGSKLSGSNKREFRKNNGMKNAHRSFSTGDSEALSFLCIHKKDNAS